jgi:putative intracellular protease/amidase
MAHLFAAIVFTAVHRLPDQRMSGYWLAEVAYPWLALAAAGWRVFALSTADEPPHSGGVDRSDRTQREFLADDAARQALAGTRRPESYDPGDFGLVLFAGGAGAVHDLPGDRGMAGFTRGVLAHGGVVSAVGYGAAGLLGLGDGLTGRRVTCPSPAEEQAQDLVGRLPLRLAGELAGCGAVVRHGRAFRPHVVADGPFVTGQNPGSAPELARLLTATGVPLSAGGSAAR